jgi:ABC-type sulfate/molybdate transport systems ATPase subunit
VPVLFVSHDPSDRERFGDAVLRIERGRLMR